MPDGKTLLDSSLKTEPTVSSLDATDGKMSLDVNFSGGTYKNLDKNSLSLSLAGKNASQINDTVTGILGEDLLRTKVDFWPFWVNKAPSNQKAVKVDLQFE
jgi:hypothetical protein